MIEKITVGKVESLIKPQNEEPVYLLTFDSHRAAILVMRETKNSLPKHWGEMATIRWQHDEEVAERIKRKKEKMILMAFSKQNSKNTVKGHSTVLGQEDMESFPVMPTVSSSGRDNFQGYGTGYSGQEDMESFPVMPSVSSSGRDNFQSYGTGYSGQEDMESFPVMPTVSSSGRDNFQSYGTGYSGQEDKEKFPSISTVSSVGSSGKVNFLGYGTEYSGQEDKENFPPISNVSSSGSSGRVNFQGYGTEYSGIEEMHQYRPGGLSVPFYNCPSSSAVNFPNFLYSPRKHY